MQATGRQRQEGVRRRRDDESPESRGDERAQRLFQGVLEPAARAGPRVVGWDVGGEDVPNGSWGDPVGEFDS